MKILKEDQNLMVIKDRNIFAFFVGVIFALAGFLVILKPDFFTNQPPLWSGFIGIALGLFVVFVAKVTTISLDKASNKLLFVSKAIINKRADEYLLNQVKAIELQQVYREQGYSYNLVFILENAKEIPLTLGSSIVKVMGKQIVNERNIGARIANFLNIPFQERRPPTVSETLSVMQSAIQNAAQKEIEKHKKG